MKGAPMPSSIWAAHGFEYFVAEYGFGDLHRGERAFQVGGQSIRIDGVGRRPSASCEGFLLTEDRFGLAEKLRGDRVNILP